MLLCLSEHMSNTERITLVDKVKASSWLATFSIEPEHDLIGSCQWQRLSWEKNKTKQNTYITMISKWILIQKRFCRSFKSRRQQQQHTAPF